MALLSGSGVLPAQVVERFYAYSVEVTQVVSTNASLFRFNNRGSFLGHDYATSTPRGYLRYANGQRFDFPATHQVDDLNNLDQVGGTRNTTPLPNLNITRAWVFDHGVFTDILAASFRDPQLVSTFAYGLSDAGYCWSQQDYIDANGQARLCSPSLVGIGNAAAGASALVPLIGIGSAQQSGPWNLASQGDMGRINANGNFLLYAANLPVSAGYFRANVSGVCVPVPLPSGFHPSHLDDQDRVVGRTYDPVTGRNATVWVDALGQVELYGQDLFASSTFPNVRGQLVGTNPATGTWFHVQQPQILRQHGGAHAALDALVNGWNGIQLLGSQRINDPGQILITAALPGGEQRFAILHPGTTPILALDFRHPRGTGARWNLPREQDGTVPFRIVGGEPGQPTALFVKLGTQYYYVDGTLGVFDSRQMFELRLPVPASLVGLDFDLSTGALDSQFGILRGLDVPITFR